MYCKKCGAKTIKRILNNNISMYDDLTGEPLYKGERVCPKKKHWWDGHCRDRSGRDDSMLLTQKEVQN